MTYIRTVVDKSNLIQACEWALWGWEPVQLAEEPYCEQRNRPDNCKDCFEYHRAARMLYAALEQRVLKLYSKLNYNGEFLDELKGVDCDNIEQAKRYYTLESDTDYFRFLSHIMASFAYDNLYFKTEELHKHIKPGHFETFSNPGYRLEFTTDGSIVLHKSDTNTLVLKQFNYGISKKFVKELFEHPNKNYTDNDFEELYSNTESRPDNIIRDLIKAMIKVIEEQENEEDQIKAEEKDFVEKSFEYNRRNFKFVKNES